jgi:hypothetical protein
VHDERGSVIRKRFDDRPALLRQQAGYGFVWFAGTRRVFVYRGDREEPDASIPIAAHEWVPAALAATVDRWLDHVGPRDG